MFVVVLIQCDEHHIDTAFFSKSNLVCNIEATDDTYTYMAEYHL